MSYCQFQRFQSEKNGLESTQRLTFIGIVDLVDCNSGGGIWLFGFLKIKQNI